MASGSVKHGRYEISSGAKELTTTKSFAGGTNTNVTANDFSKPNNPSGYYAFPCGIRTGTALLAFRYVNPHNNTTNTIVAIRNVGSDLNDRTIKVKYTYLRSDMIDDQRS